MANPEADVIMGYNNTEILKQFIVKVIDQRLSQLGILQGFFEPGKIESIVDNRANIYINGSTSITPNIPIVNNLILSPNDEVWILKVNFSNIDKLVLCKRLI